MTETPALWEGNSLLTALNHCSVNRAATDVLEVQNTEQCSTSLTPRATTMLCSGPKSHSGFLSILKSQKVYKLFK